MSLIEELGGVTAQVARLALDAALLRHNVISHNIANAATQDFSPVRLRFEEHLNASEGAPLSARGDEELRARIAQIQDHLASPAALGRDGERPVELDEEVVRLANNTLRYRALLEGVGKRGAILRTAIEEGRR